jgi:Zn-dependent alcohol dehydrogenase
MVLTRTFTTLVRLGSRQASTYRAAVLREIGQPLKIEEVKPGKLGKDQVLYKHASSSMTTDT